MNALRWLTLPLRLPRFTLFFLRELVRANLRVAREVLTPGFSMQAGVVAVPTRTRDDLETVLLANAITLTPGTLTLEVDPETRTLFVHALYAEPRAAFLADLARLEDEVLRLTRGRSRAAHRGGGA